MWVRVDERRRYIYLYSIGWLCVYVCYFQRKYRFSNEHIWKKETSNTQALDYNLPESIKGIEKEVIACVRRKK